MNTDAFKLGFTLDEFTAEVNRDSPVQYTNQQTEPFWSAGQSPGQARDKLIAHCGASINGAFA